MALPHGAWPRVACVGPVDRNENGYDVTSLRCIVKGRQIKCHLLLWRLGTKGVSVCGVASACGIMISCIEIDTFLYRKTKPMDRARRPTTRLRPAAARGDERETPRLAREAAVRRSGHARFSNGESVRRSLARQRDSPDTLTFTRHCEFIIDHSAFSTNQSVMMKHVLKCLR